MSIKGKPNVSRQKCSDEQILAALKDNCFNRDKAAAQVGLSTRKLVDRISRMRARGDRVDKTSIDPHKAFFKQTIDNGVVLVGTDPHFWPNEFTTCQRAFLYFAANMEPRPKAIVMNGDVFDGSRVSRHPKIGFLEKRPSVKDELDVCELRLSEIEAVAPKGCPLVWPLGNHDLRYESYLAASVPEYEGISGMHLKDRFPAWTPCWTYWINPEQTGWTEIKHRFRGGIHATYNNALRSGVSMITGHLHSLKVYPWTDRRGTRFGVDAGTLADVDGENIGGQFVNYLEANPVDWRSGFIVLTFKDGRLLWPEVVHKYDEHHVEFRGNLIEV